MRAPALAGVLLIAAFAAPPASILVRDQGWTPASPERVRQLTHSPGECLANPTPETEIGRALFRTPVLLGGPAARAGLSCNACHSDGRANAHFLMPELTNRPGAADVTSEWASKVRGDGAMNPRDIPDLAGVSTRTSFGHLHEPSLETFVQSVIVEEFQGAPPPQQAFDGLISYLRALDAGVCPAMSTPITLTHAADDVRRAIGAARSADAPTASLLLYAAQDGMGRIVERLPPADFGRDRRLLETLARDLGALRQAPDIPATLAQSAWIVRFDVAIARIAPREAQTYFNETTLAAALSD